MSVVCKEGKASGLLYSHPNTIKIDTELETNQNYYSDGMLIISPGVTLTIPPTTLLQIK
jgi:hypothetical protein